MGFKDVIALFTGPRGAAGRLKLAAELLRPQSGHLTGLYLVPEVAPFAGGLPFTETEVRALKAIEAERRAAMQKATDEVATELRTAAADAGLTYEWRVVEGDIIHAAVAHVRHADLAVVGQADPDHPAPAPHLVESLLLGSGRPVLAVPYAGHFATLGHNVLVAWNGTREAARAINDALPLLAKADKVTLLTVNPPGAEGDGRAWPGADIALHLARHGCNAEASATVSHDIDAGNIILSRAADFGADLIVMGGYGHSRQREFMLGGVTRTLLQHMTVPVLLAH